ncbi:MAG TPA: hypothetical protein VJN96_12990 [Vicinamibacterales bacterium]|nr:hypothetical protein [Vicinamibacterales bacterium]
MAGAAPSVRWGHVVGVLRWIDGTPLSQHIEPYRARLFDLALDTFESDGRPRFNLIVCGRAKKNWKTADLVLGALFALVSESPAGHDSECYLLANDGDQARDDLSLAKKIVKANPDLAHWLKVRANSIERRDGRGFLEVLPAGDVVGQHGKSYRFVGYDEIHGYRTWDVLEAMQPDPHRLDAQQWITSYASLFHRPGVPLFDLIAQGKAGTDPRMLFSWYAADFTTDPAFADLPPERRANPSMASWGDDGYLVQQQRRLPSHKFRRLHLNLPGLPEGSAFQPEPVMDAIARGVSVRLPERGTSYTAFVDMSGGSSDDAVLAIGHADTEGRAVLDLVQDQGAAVPFNPNKAVERFVRTLKEYGLRRVTGDRYAGETFRAQFAEAGIGYSVAPESKSALYEALEPVLNAGSLVLLDVALLEQQLLGLVWRGGKIDHQAGEHDDLANAVAGVTRLLSAGRTDAQAAEVARMCLSIGDDEPRSAWLQSGLPMASDGCPRP